MGEVLLVALSSLLYSLTPLNPNNFEWCIVSDALPPPCSKERREDLPNRESPKKSLRCSLSGLAWVQVSGLVVQGFKDLVKPSNLLTADFQPESPGTIPARPWLWLQLIGVAKPLWLRPSFFSIRSALGFLGFRKTSKNANPAMQDLQGCQPRN